MQANEKSATKPLVLLIHPDATVAATCRNALEKHGFELETVPDGSQGVHQAYRLIPDVVIAGSATPELNGYQVCRMLKNDPVMKRTPILLIADRADKMDRFWSVKAGGDDFLQTDEVETKLLRKIQTLMEVYQRIGLEERHNLKAVYEKNPLNVRTRLGQIMDASLVESTLMVEFRGLADLVHDAGLLNYMLFSLLESLVEYDAAAIFYNDENKNPRQLTFHVPDGAKISKAQVETLMDRFFAHFKDRIPPQQMELLESEVVGTLDDEAEPVNYQTCYLKEVCFEGRLLGAICLYARESVDFPRIFPVQLIEDEIRLLMKLRNLYSRAEVLAVTDGLTGLFNQKHFLNLLEREFKTSQRYGVDLSLALISVDHFKRLNSEWGHVCGDEALRHIAQLAETSFRGVDILARFGGKHIAVLLPKTGMEQAQIALQRFQVKVQETPFQWGTEAMNLTVSGGLVTLAEETSGASTLLQLAEAALQQARRQDGNRLETSQNER